MKRTALLAGVVIALVILAVVAVPNLISADRIKQRIAENIIAMTGRQVVLTGAPVLTIYPNVAITVAGLTIANPDGTSGDPLLTSDSVTARVRLFPLLMGNAQFDLIELTKPRIHLVTNVDGGTNFALPAPAGSGAASPAAPRTDATASPTAEPRRPVAVAGTASPAPPRRIKITAGTLVYDDVATARHEEVSEIDMEAAWRDATAPITGTGVARWHGELVEFNGQLGDPRALINGTPSSLRLALAARPIRVSFTGTVGPAIEGSLNVSTPALRRLLEWAGAVKPMGNGPTLGAASLQGKIDWQDRDISFADAKIELDGNMAVGAFTYNYVGRKPLVEGTLASPRLDFSAYLEALKGDTTALIGAASLPLADVLDADFRVSSDEILIGPLRFIKAAGAVTMKAASVMLSLTQAGIYDGLLTADAKVARFGERLVSEATGKLTNVAARPALSDLAAVQSVAGIASGSFEFRTQGANWGEFVQGLTARGSFSVANGTLSGLDVNDLASLVDAPALPLAPGAGSMPFGKLSATVTLDSGIIETKDAVVSGANYRIDVKGWASLASGLVNATATLAPPAVGSVPGKAIPIAISGNWRRPLFELDRGRSASPPPTPPRG